MKGGRRAEAHDGGRPGAEGAWHLSAQRPRGHLSRSVVSIMLPGKEQTCKWTYAT